MSEETKMWETLQCLPDAVEHLIHGDPDDADSVKASDAVAWAIAEIVRLREERDALLESQMWGVNCKPTPELPSAIAARHAEDEAAGPFVGRRSEQARLDRGTLLAEIARLR